MKTRFLIGWMIASSCCTFSQDSFGKRLSQAALFLTREHVVYDPAYYAIDFRIIGHFAYTNDSYLKR